MIEDDVLSTITYQVDGMIGELLQQTQIGILPLSAIILARLVLANDEVELSDDIRSLLIEAASYPPKKDQVMQ